MQIITILSKITPLLIIVYTIFTFTSEDYRDTKIFCDKDMGSSDCFENHSRLVLSDWMGNLPDRVKLLPFFNLAIPGTHDSLTYTISAKSKFAPDAPDCLMKICLGYPLRKIVSLWSRTQSEDVVSQLEHGIRYIDIRLATKPNTTELYVCHALYGDAITPHLEEMNTFLNSHPGEILILDFQHFYAFKQSDHLHLLNRISEIFGDKVLKFSSTDMDKYTLKYLTQENKFQVIVIYRNNSVPNTHWPSDYFPTPWPDTTCIPTLFNMLDEIILKRDPNRGLVSQIVITPDNRYIFKHIWSSLRATSRKVFKPMLRWIGDKSPGPNGVNVTIADFVEMKNWLYSSQVIRLNQKL